MGLARADREFRHPGVSYLDYKQVDMDRVLTGLLPRLWWNGSPSVLLGAPADLDVDTFTDALLANPHLFESFERDVTHRWVETYLLDLINRGRPNQSVAGLRPLHGFTYRFRVARRSRPYGADEQLYWMLHHANGVRGNAGPVALAQLKQFFFTGVDPRTSQHQQGRDIDVETQALINLSRAETHTITDRAATSAPMPHPPLDPVAGDLLANDVLALLHHSDVIPRSTLVEHLKMLFALHLALYHLHLLRLLPALLSGTETIGPAPRVGIFVDVAGSPGTAAARIAEKSAQQVFTRIPEFIRATFTVRKLDDFARELIRRHQLKGSLTDIIPVTRLIDLLGSHHDSARESFGAIGLDRAVKALQSEEKETDRITADLIALGLDSFSTYIEVITAQRIDFHRKYVTQCLDTLLLKSRPGAVIAQPRGGARRFVLDSRLIEVLLQLALLRPDGRGGFHTAPLRIDEFLTVLKQRYGLYVDEFPPDGGLGNPSIADQAVLRENRRAFVSKLREIGFYSDLSDAYITQTIMPRYRLGATES